MKEKVDHSEHDSQTNIAIIPARGGSKRIVKKNIREFMGKPMIAYAIDHALSSGLFKEVFVSTDDEEIASIARQLGAHVPVLRSPKNSDDHATTSDVLEEVLAFYAEKDIHPEICCCIYPTTPLLNPDDLRSAFETFHHGQFDTVISAVRYDFPIQRAFQLGSNNSVMIEHPECMSMRSQDLPVHYHDAGAFYFFRTEQFLKTRDLWKGSIGAYLLPESRVQDIDTPQDWNLAEIKFKAL